MSETSAEIFAEASKLSMVTNPGHSPVSRKPQDTTRSLSAIEQDIMTIQDIIVRYDDACIEETGKPGRRQLNANPYWNLCYARFHFIKEHECAEDKGNS